MLTLKTPKADNKYFCEHCNFGCNKISGYNKHLLTSKHERLTNPNKLPPNDKPHMCGCGKRYKHRQSLYLHRKKCLFINSENEEVPSDKPYECKCNKLFKHHSSYSRHKKTCTFINSENKEVQNNDKETQTTESCYCDALLDIIHKKDERIDMLINKLSESLNIFELLTQEKNI